MLGQTYDGYSDTSAYGCENDHTLVQQYEVVDLAPGHVGGTEFSPV